MQRFDDFDRDFTLYNGLPIGIGIEQPLFAFNPLKWDKKTEPLRYEESQQAIVELLSAISSLQPIRAVLPEGSESISLTLNSTVRVSELTKLHLRLSVPALLGSAPPSSYIDLVGVQLAEANEAQKIDLKPLCDHHLNKLLIRIFKGSELYDSKVKDLEAQKRIDRFEALTGVDVKAANESDSDES